MYMLGITFRRINIGEKCQNVDFLGGCEFHSRDKHNAVFLRDPCRRTTVPAGIMIGYGDYVKPFESRHSDDICGGAVIVAAR
jgi:hypothetical protein